MAGRQRAMAGRQMAMHRWPKIWGFRGSKRDLGSFGERKSEWEGQNFRAPPARASIRCFSVLYSKFEASNFEIFISVGGGGGGYKN